MNKKCIRLITLLLAIIMLTSIMPLNLFAEENKDNKIDLSNKVAIVFSDDEAKGTYYEDINSAWKDACNKGYIRLLKDWKTTKVLTVPKDKSVTVFMDDHSIDRGLEKSAKSGEVFLLEEKSTLTVYGIDPSKIDPESEEIIKTNAKIKGGYNSNGGGGIHVKEKATVNLFCVNVCENKTDEDNGGGGVRLQGKKSKLIMDKHSLVDNNTAVKGVGGGISVAGEDAQIEGGTVSNNKASGNGGGINVAAKNCSISSVAIKKNEAGNGKKGGGIYMAQGCGASVFGCKIEENKVVNGYGGGIYVDGNGGTLSDSVVEKNVAGPKNGGGIFVDVGDALGLSGELKIKDNNQDFSKENPAFANLFLSTTSKKEAYIFGCPEKGEVHIGWDTSIRTDDKKGLVKLSKDKEQCTAKYFVCDVPNYYIYWSWQTNDEVNDRVIRASKKDYNYEVDVQKTEVPANDRYTVYENKYENKYALQEGIYTYKGTSGGNVDAVYYYSDGYFEKDPKEYNTHLATMSMALTMSAFNADETDFDKSLGNEYLNRFRNAKLLLSDIGVANENIYISDTFCEKPTEDSIGVIMGAKNITINGNEYILLPIAVRGAGYESEWTSNVTLGTKGEAAGFSDAASKVMGYLDDFLKSDVSVDINGALAEGRVKFWVVGFSRAAATANLVSKRLTDKYGEKNNQVYGYTFETPKGGVDSEVLKKKWTYEGQYLNIHNIINTGDIVPYVGPEEMGFKRYGVDHFVPGTDAVTPTKEVYDTPTKLSVTKYTDNKAYVVGDDNYRARRVNMLMQLQMVNDTVKYDDYFSLATINYMGYAASSKPMVGELKNGTKTTVDKWIPRFFRHLQEWATNGTYSLSSVDGHDYGGDYRKFYTSNIDFSDEHYVSIEDALRCLTKLMFGLDNSDEMMEALMFRLDKFKSNSSVQKDYYMAVVAMWDEQAKFRQRKYYNEVWGYLTKDMTYPNGKDVPSITDFVESKDEKELKDSIYALCSYLFLFVCKDYDKQPNLSGVDTTQIHLGTLAYNMTNILQNHYPEVCMAWLRTYDSHYTKNDTFKYEDKAVDLKIDKSVVSGEVIAEYNEKDNKTEVTLKYVTGSEKAVDANSVNNGAAIYYQVYKNGNLITDWTLYRESFYLYNTDSAEYEVKTYATRFGLKTGNGTLSDEAKKEDPSLRGSFIGKGSVIVLSIFALIVMVAVVVIFVKNKKKNNIEPDDVDDNENEIDFQLKEVKEEKETTVTEKKKEEQENTVNEKKTVVKETTSGKKGKSNNKKKSSKNKRNK